MADPQTTTQGALRKQWAQEAPEMNFTNWLVGEITRLRDALETMIYETTHLSPERDDGSHDCRVSREALGKARKAMK